MINFFSKKYNSNATSTLRKQKPQSKPRCVKCGRHRSSKYRSQFASKYPPKGIYSRPNYRADLVILHVHHHCFLENLKKWEGASNRAAQIEHVSSIFELPTDPVNHPTPTRRHTVRTASNPSLST